MKTKLMLVAVACLFVASVFGAETGQVSSSVPMFGTRGLVRLDRDRDNMTFDMARDFFNWTIQTNAIFRKDGTIIPGWNEFKSSKGHTLYVGNDTYKPAQPLVAFDKTVQALNEMNKTFDVKSVGSFANDANIFAQFAIDGKTEFSVNGKDYKGYLTMAKGNDESLPLSYWLTIVCIVCANTFRLALSQRKRNGAVIMKQTKHSEQRLQAIQNEIKALFELRETVQATLQRMASTPVGLGDAERAFLGLIKHGESLDDIVKDTKQTGKTRLTNTLERYMAAFAKSPGVNKGETVEDWFNAVTYVDTKGNEDSPAAKKNLTEWREKQFLSSEFGSYADRKSLAFSMASKPETWAEMVQTGDSIMQALLAKPVVVSTVPTAIAASVANDMDRLLARPV